VVSIRSNVEGVTLLHFLASHIRNTDPDLLHLPADLAHTEVGASISFTSLSELMKSIQTELEIAIGESEQSTGKDAVMRPAAVTRLKKILADFLPHSKKYCQSLTDQHAKCQSLIKEAKALYAEMSPSVSQEELCRAFSTFKTALVSVIKDNETARAKLNGDSPRDGMVQGVQSHLKAGVLASSELRSETESVQSIVSAGTSSFSATSLRNELKHASASSTPLDDWLLNNHLEAYTQVLKLNRVTLDGLVDLTDDDLKDLGILETDKKLMLKAITKLKHERQGIPIPLEKSSTQYSGNSLTSSQSANANGAPALAPQSRVPARDGSMAWGECYGGGGQAAKGQKHGWVEIQRRGVNRWENFYAKRAKNTLVLFASNDDEDLSRPIQLMCLDGVVVNRSDDVRPFVVQARKSIFQESKDDFFLAAISNKEAASWEKALIKGSMWHAENKDKVPSSGASIRSTEVTHDVVPPRNDKGLTPEELQSVGHVFTFKRKTPSSTIATNDTGAGVFGAGVFGGASSTPARAANLSAGAAVKSVGVESHADVSLMEQRARKAGALSFKFLTLELGDKKNGPMQSPFLAITITTTVDGKVLMELVADVQIRGIPADAENMKTIGVTRSITIPPHFSGTSEITVCIELRHHKASKVSTRAWTYISINGIANGERRLQLYEKPVQFAEKAPKTTPCKGWFLTLEVCGEPGLMLELAPGIPD